MVQKRDNLKQTLKSAQQKLKWQDQGQQGPEATRIKQLEEEILATQYGKELQIDGDSSSRVCSSMKSSRK